MYLSIYLIYLGIYINLDKVLIMLYKFHWVLHQKINIMFSRYLLLKECKWNDDTGIDGSLVDESVVHWLKGSVVHYLDQWLMVEWISGLLVK